MVKVDVSETPHDSKLRIYDGRLAIAEERLSNGDWLVTIGTEKITLPLKFLRHTA